MRKSIFQFAFISLCAVSLLLFTRKPTVRATGTVTRWVGDVTGSTRGVTNGPPNSTVLYNIVESNPGLIVYALTQNGTYSNSLTLTFNLDGSGNGSASYFSKAVQAGDTTETICSPQLGCASDSPTYYTVLTPASGVAKIQYLKDGTFTDVPTTVNVVKGDTVSFKAIPSPTGSVFFFASDGPHDPTWSGSSGATGIGDTTTVIFNTLSKNNHDYKTVTATVGNGGGSSTANVIVGDGVTSVSLQPVDPSTLFNDNPNAGGGKRIFPDKNAPSDTVNRRRVRVTALTTFGARQTIYFKSFDLDDPSTDAAPVDSNGSAGNDNRGGLGTAQQYGILSPVGGNGTTNSASATTDANGFASVDLMVTMQPGDNFMVAASQDSTYINGLTVSGITLKDSSGNTVGPSTSKAKASPMLTVWRWVHLEVDSMDVVPTVGPQKNSVTGKVISVNGTSTIATIVVTDQNLDDGSPKLDNPPPNTGNGRFENGKIRIGTTGNVTETTDLGGNGTFYVEKNTGNGIVIPSTVSKSGETDVTGNVLSLLSNVFKISITGGTLTANFVGGTITVAGVSMTITAVNDTDSSVTINALADIPVELVDDDAAMLPQLPDTSLMGQKYQPAYILPIVDGGGSAANNKTNVPFKLYIQSDDNSVLDAELNVANALESDGSRADNFWIAYVLTAYQGSPFSVALNRGDNDCDSEAGLGAVNSGVNGRGAFIFIEDIRDEERELGIIIGPTAAPHEIAHQFGLLDCGSPAHPCDSTIHDIMGGTFYLSDSRFSDADLNTLRNRIKSPGRQ